MPLNLLDVHLLHNIFPSTKRVLALRHPMDCVLSCFMQNFKLNLPMATMLSTQTAAGLYDAGMQKFDQAAFTYGLQVHAHKYEALIDAQIDSLRSLLSFLKLPWNSAVLDNVGQATARGRINTPSYAQVSQPLYSTSKERWRRYQTELAPCKETLRPWIERYDYETRNTPEHVDIE